MGAKFGADRILLSPPPLFIFCLIDDPDGGLKTIELRRLSAEALPKRLFTMLVAMNAGRGGYIDLVAKGKGKRITKGRESSVR